LGKVVEFDPAVNVIHLRPLQNRPVSPSMRVVTRYSRLRFFEKHVGPIRSGLISGLTVFEAILRGVWCNLFKRKQEAAAWRLVRKMTLDFLRGRRLSGVKVRDLAASLESTPSPALAGPHTGKQRANTHASRE
jgi:hypothetical protein